MISMYVMFYGPSWRNTYDLFLSSCGTLQSVQLQKHLTAEDHPYHKFSTGQ